MCTSFVRFRHDEVIDWGCMSRMSLTCTRLWLAVLDNFTPKKVQHGIFETCKGKKIPQRSHQND